MSIKPGRETAPSDWAEDHRQKAAKDILNQRLPRQDDRLKRAPRVRCREARELGEPYVTDGDDHITAIPIPSSGGDIPPTPGGSELEIDTAIEAEAQFCGMRRGRRIVVQGRLRAVIRWAIRHRKIDPHGY